jgi:hypothetical protein
MDLVIVAGVGHPVGVFGRTGMLVIAPVVTSSASRIGVSRVFSGVGPAPDMPGTVESMVFARTSAIIGRRGLIPGSSERKGVDIRYTIGSPE